MGVAVAALPEVDRQSPPPEIFDYKSLGHLRTSNYKILHGVYAYPLGETMLIQVANLLSRDGQSGPQRALAGGGPGTGLGSMS